MYHRKLLSLLPMVIHKTQEILKLNNADKGRKRKSNKMLYFNISYDLFFTYIIYRFVLDMDIAQICCSHEAKQQSIVCICSSIKIVQLHPDMLIGGGTFQTMLYGVHFAIDGSRSRW